MKKTLLLIFACFPFFGTAQVTNQAKPASWELNTEATIEAINLPQLDIQNIKKEDVINDKLHAKPFRIGIPKKINYGLENSGSWTQLANGDRIWRILFHSKNAIHLSVVFNQFYIPKGGQLFLYNNRTSVLGTYTNAQNNKEQVLGTWLVYGDKLWIEYYEPKEVKGQANLHISSIIHGYRLGNTYQKGYNSLLKINNSGNCNHDVDCPIGADFEANRDVLKKSVGFLNMGDGYICSGALVNNTNQDKKPYFLTANHCLEREDDEDPANPILFSMRFNWISPNPICAKTTNSTNATANLIVTGGVTIKAKNGASDFMLLELKKKIPNDWDVTFASWDKTDANPTYEVGIHHPSGDIMKICRDDTGAIKATSDGKQLWLIGGLNDFGTNTSGNGWELGVTEGGSSGSPLFNQNGDIIGQLYAGEADCTGTGDNSHYDVYGRFATSWDRGTTASTRLKDWLDPENKNPNTLDALQNILAINDEVLDKNISIFPNPTSGLVQIQIKEKTANLNYEVYTVLGQAVLRGKLQHNKVINLARLPNAIYYLKITEEETHKSIVKKIVLRK